MPLSEVEREGGRALVVYMIKFFNSSYTCTRAWTTNYSRMLPSSYDIFLREII